MCLGRPPQGDRTARFGVFVQDVTHTPDVLTAVVNVVQTDIRSGFTGRCVQYVTDKTTPGCAAPGKQPVTG